MATTDSQTTNCAASSPIYTGVYRHSVDPKNRITIPSKWRRGETEELILSRGHNDENLVAYSQEEFQARWKKVESNTAIPEKTKANFKRAFSARAREVVVDKQGRMVVPQDLCASVGIGQDIVLVGTMNEFQLWAPDRYEPVAARDQEDFNTVAGMMGL